MMSINQIYSKLRKNNIKNYYLLIFSIILSVVLITSYALMILSPTVLNVLPQGGDSRKQALMIFAIALSGCVVFTTYASSIFFKYKSRETGILLALGANKTQIKKVLFTELVIISVISSFVGMVLSLPISFFIWKLFRYFIVDTKEMTYIIGWNGFIFSAGYCLFITLTIFLMGVSFINKTNIMDRINEHRKSEPIREVKNWYGIIGFIFIIIGLTCGYFIPDFIITVLKHSPSPLWNLLFILSLIGIYMVMIYATVSNKKRKNPKKYYKNIIPKSMMKFQGRQTVRNMCVITLLIAAALFATFYTPNTLISAFRSFSITPIDYAFNYKLTENQIQKDEIYDLAKEYDVNITYYDELFSATLIVDGTDKVWESNGNIVDHYYEKYKNIKFVSESDFNRIAGININIKEGHYAYIKAETDTQSIYFSYDDVSKLTNPVTMKSEDLKFQETITYIPLHGQYILDDTDYKRHTEILSDNNFENNIFFNVQNVDTTYDFAKQLLSKFVSRSSQDVAVIPSYDEYMAKVSKENGVEYWPNEYNVELDPNSTELFLDWKYYPKFRILNQQNLVKNMAVFLMLFIFISIICFAAVTIIAYTRSLTIAINNKQLYDDLKRLGAKNSYIKRCIKQQLKKIFALPTIIGSIIIFIFYFMIMLGNGHTLSIDTNEQLSLIANVGIIIISCGYMYIIYKFTLKKVCSVIGV